MKHNMRKRVLGVVLALMAVLPVLTLEVFADMGPKPSVIVDFTGIPEGAAYYVTLLAEETSTGPWNKGGSYFKEENEAVWERYLLYRDTDGFNFLEYIAKCTGTNRFIWGYYPPERFKILVYFPETDTFAVTEESYEQYAFDSYYTAELRPDGTLTAKRTYAAYWQVTAFLMRLALTMAVELLLALLFAFRGRELLVICGANAVTQVLLNVVLLHGGYEPFFFWYVIQYGFLELLIFAAEATVYVYALTLPKLGEPEKGPGHPILYAFIANLSSFVLGYLISVRFPQFF